MARLKTWVTKKIAELLGEEEATFIDFILGLCALQVGGCVHRTVQKHDAGCFC